MGFANILMLIGLAALAIPPLIHLLNRRRYEVVDWGAMQFLQISEVTRRRLMLEELLLMALRMGLLALLALGMAAPWLESRVFTKLGARPNRDVVLILDGSASMGATASEQSPHDAAKDWVRSFLNELTPGDGVTLLQARQQVVPVVGTLSHDPERVRGRLDQLPPPGGGCDLPAAVQAAHAILAESKRPERDIIILGDGQRYGWADDNALLRWGVLATSLGYKKAAPDDPGKPRLWVVNLDPERPAEVRNWSLTPLRGSRAVAPVDREVTFRTDLVLSGQTEYAPPHRIRLEVDGQRVRNLEPPRGIKLEKGKVPLAFTHRFAKPGSHLVSVILEADPPPEERPANYVIKDQVPGDNRQDFAFDVVQALPVLLVDGDPTAKPPRRGSDFLRDALAPARDPTPAVQTRVVAAAEFDAGMLGGEGTSRPRVLVLCNVAQLTSPQQEAVVQFLADGGGVLVTLGERVDAEFYNAKLFRDGRGWLPARLDGTDGDAADPRGAMRPEAESCTHPALEMFAPHERGGKKEVPPGGLAGAKFPRWWKLTTPGRDAAGVPVGVMRNPRGETPFLVERSFRAGRVLACAVPLDDTWETNLTSLPGYVPLAHELIYYLAGARAAELNLEPGQPLRYRMDTDAPPQNYTLRPPTGEEKPLAAGTPNGASYPAQILRQQRGALLVYDGTRETGVYRLTTPEQQTVYYVVRPDARESDLTPCGAEDRRRVAEYLPVRYENERGKMSAALAETSTRQEFWWPLLLGVIVLLCGEVLMTRRMVKRR